MGMTADGTAKLLSERGHFTVTVKPNDWAAMPIFVPLEDLQIIGKFWLMREEIIAMLNAENESPFREYHKADDRHRELADKIEKLIVKEP